MPRAVRHVAEPKQIPLLDARIELQLAADVVRVASPPHEVGDGAGGAIAVKHLPAEPWGRKVVLDSGERLRGGACQEAAWRLIAVDRTGDEIVLARVADIHNKPWHDLDRVHETVRGMLGMSISANQDLSITLLTI